MDQNGSIRTIFEFVIRVIRVHPVVRFAFFLAKQTHVPESRAAAFSERLVALTLR
jgi:hypothetical protein